MQLETDDTGATTPEGRDTAMEQIISMAVVAEGSPCDPKSALVLECNRCVEARIRRLVEWLARHATDVLMDSLNPARRTGISDPKGGRALVVRESSQG